MDATSSLLTPAQPYAAHQQIAGMVAQGASALIEQLGGRYSLHTGIKPAAPELTALRQVTIDGLAAALLRGRFHFPEDVPAFRHGGRACAGAGLEPDAVVGVMDEAAEALRDELLIPAARACEMAFEAGAVDAAIAAHCKVIDDLTRAAYRQLLAAFAEQLAAKRQL